MSRGDVVLVTGNHGRVGRATVDALRRAGHNVEGFDVSSGQDVLDAGAVDHAVSRAHVVVHLAAQLRRALFPADILNTNVLGTWNVLAAAARHGVERVVIASSLGALGDDPRWASPERLPFRHDHPATPASPYEWSKLLAEQLCHRFSATTGIPTLCLRPPGVVSSEQIADVRQERRQRASREWSAGWWFGAFIHIDDLVDALLSAVVADSRGSATALLGGPDVASAIPTAELCARFLPEARLDPPRGSDLFWPTVDTGPAEGLLGWRPSRVWGRDESESFAARFALRHARARGQSRTAPPPLPPMLAGFSGLPAGEVATIGRWPWSQVPALWDELAAAGPVPFATAQRRPALVTPLAAPLAERASSFGRGAARRVPALSVLASKGRRSVDEVWWRSVRRRPSPAWPTTPVAWATVVERDLKERVLPHWYDSAQDGVHGGYLLGRDIGRPAPPVAKQLISQARMVWGFALAHRLGLGDGRRDYLAAAQQGRDFLDRHFADPEHGGYRWMTLLDGTPTDERKMLSGHAFVVYALVELHRAANDSGPLHQAVEVFETVQRHLHDGETSGWREAAGADWRPTTVSDALTPGRPGCKSGDGHLHVMESLTQLAVAAARDEAGAAVVAALKEAVDVNLAWFFPPDPAAAVAYRAERAAFLDRASDRLSLGHNVEFAWLLQPALAALGREPNIGFLDRYVRHALRAGWDERNGGQFDWNGAAGAVGRRKTWWTQAELLAALSNLIAATDDRTLEPVLVRHLRFIWARQREPATGMWLTAVGPRGQPWDGGTASEWKAAYHDVRAMVEFVAATTGWNGQDRFGAAAPGARSPKLV